MSPINSKDKWGLEMWEHEKGHSRAAKEYEKLPLEIQRFVEKRLKILFKYSFDNLRVTNDLEKIGEISELKIKVPRNEIRILGVEQYPQSSNEVPTFDALLVFHKKTQKIKKEYLKTAHKRYKEYEIS